MTLRRITLATTLIASVCLKISQWAASGVPTVVQTPGALVMSGADHPTFTFQCDSDRRMGSIIPLMITYIVASKTAIADGPSGSFHIVDSRTAATQNVDGSWSISPWWLFRAAWRSGADPRSLEWRVLLAYPVLPTVSMKRGHYLNSHFCKQES